MAKIKANLAGVDPGTERPCPPDGIYMAEVVEMLDDKPTNGKGPRLVIRSQIINADDERFNGYPLWSYFPYDQGTKTWSKESPMAWKVVQMLLALYGTDKVTIDTDAPPEEPFQFKGKVENYQGKDRLKLDTWLPLSDEDEELDEDEDEPEDEDDETTDEADEDDEDEASDEEDDQDDEEDEEEDEEPEPVAAKSRRSTKASAAAPAKTATKRGSKKEPEPEPEAEEDDDVPDYPDWTTQELEDEVKVRKLQLTLPRADKAKRKAMIDALNEDDAAAEDPLAS
jgi:hypothetical protein